MILFNKTEECFYLIVLDDLRPNIQRINNTCLRYATLFKRDSNTCAFCEYCESFKNAYFEEYYRYYYLKHFRKAMKTVLF